MKNTNTPGRVYLVGAGPGSPDLLTKKAERLLHSADVIVYDRLVGTEILAMIPEDKRCIDVGKHAGFHPVPQEGIGRILVDEAKAGHVVVRLKGGDPFLFGRGGEEMEVLLEARIPVEVVPGITSALAVPAYAGIPVTNRADASGVHIITAHRREGEPRAIDYEALVQSGDTLVFLMGVAQLPHLMEGLLKAGADPTLPAAIVEEGSRSGQRHLVATVATLADAAREEKYHAPSVIVVGDVCRHADAFCTFEKKPLFGRRYLVARPEGRGEALCERLRELGAEAIAHPTVRLVPREDDIDWEQVITYRMIVFTSAYGVHLFFERLLDGGKDARFLSMMHFAAIGQTTAEALKEYGILADVVPEHYDSASLAKAITDHIDTKAAWEVRPYRVLLVRSSAGSEVLMKGLLAAGGVVADTLSLYDVVPIETSRLSLPSYFLDDKKTSVIFTNSLSVRGFVMQWMTGMHVEENANKDVDKNAIEDAMRGIEAICIGEATATAAREAGFYVRVAENATEDAIVAALDLKKESKWPTSHLW